MILDHAREMMVDTDSAKFVDDNVNISARLLRQVAPQQCRLAAPKEAGKDRNGAPSVPRHALLSALRSRSSRLLVQRVQRLAGHLLGDPPQLPHGRGEPLIALAIAHYVAGGAPIVADLQPVLRQHLTQQADTCVPFLPAAGFARSMAHLHWIELTFRPVDLAEHLAAEHAHAARPMTAGMAGARGNPPPSLPSSPSALRHAR